MVGSDESHEGSWSLLCVLGFVYVCWFLLLLLLLLFWVHKQLEYNKGLFM